MRLAPGADPEAPQPPTLDAARVLDPRVWLVWLAAVTFPALAGRNPFPLLGLLVVVLVVRGAWARALTRDAGWTLVLRLALFAAAISVAFNLLAAPFGDQVLLRLPEWWPLGDVMTLNALVYGLMGALAIIVIILAGTVAGALVDWPALLRMIPGRLLPLAVAGSIAWAFVPQTVATIRDIRDAQRSRGLRFDSARSVLPLLIPLIATSLERASTMAEALESRGFGGRSEPTVVLRRWRSRAFLVAGLALGVLAAASGLDGRPIVAAIAAGLAVAALGWSLALVRGVPSRTRYRRRRWTIADRAVLGAALVSLVLSVSVWLRHREAVAWSPYPDITVPAGNGWLMVAVLVLLAPAMVAPLVAGTNPSISRAVLAPVGEASRPNESPPIRGVGSRPPSGWNHGIGHRGRPFACWPPRVVGRRHPRRSGAFGTRRVMIGA